MSNKVTPYGKIRTYATAGNVVTAYSLDDAKVYVKEPNGALTLLGDVKAGVEYVSAALSVAKTIEIEAGGSDVLYSIGTSAVVTDRRGLRGQGAPVALNATGALTAAAIASGVVTSTTAAAVTATLPTGAVMDAALELKVGESIDWSVIVTGDTNTLTVAAAASGHTLVGAGAVVERSSGLFRTRKSTVATYVTYRIG